MKPRQLVKRVINEMLGPLGLEIVRKGTVGQPQVASPVAVRSTLRGALLQVKRLGLLPGTVFDVGAASGTPPLYETFPDARHVLIDPLVENEPLLAVLARSLKSAEYLIAAAAEEAGTLTINVHPDLVGSSLYLESEDSGVNGVPRVVPTVRLNDLRRERALPAPYVVKVDVQGAELDVLRGATEVLAETEYVILETSLFHFFGNSPLAYDVMTFMKEWGFALYDLVDCGYRPLDGAMSQVDMGFVKETGAFRRHHFYATREQRAAQDALFAKARGHAP